MGKINHVCKLSDIVSVVRATLLAQIQTVHAQFWEYKSLIKQISGKKHTIQTNKKYRVDYNDAEPLISDAFSTFTGAMVNMTEQNNDQIKCLAPLLTTL